VKITARKLNGPIAAGLNGAFAVEFPMGIALIFGGAPFRMADMTHLGRVGYPTYRVKCATEVPGDADDEVPCQDYSVPRELDLLNAVERAIQAAFQGRAVFAGCYGGIGRTGVFMATVLKVLMPDMMDYVGLTRNLYLRGTIETEEQMELVDEIEVDALRRKVKWMWVRAVIRQALFGR
jgi:hypothetical protein